MSRWGPSFLLALIAVACALALVGCAGSDGSGSEPPKTVASAGHERSGADPEAGGTNKSGSAKARQAGALELRLAPGQPPPRVLLRAPLALQVRPARASPRQEALATSEAAHKSPKSHSGGKSGGGPTAGLSPQAAATYETARALCAPTPTPCSTHPRKSATTPMLWPGSRRACAGGGGAGRPRRLPRGAEEHRHRLTGRPGA